MAFCLVAQRALCTRVIYNLEDDHRYSTVNVRCPHPDGDIWVNRLGSRCFPVGDLIGSVANFHLGLGGSGLGHGFPGKPRCFREAGRESLPPPLKSGALSGIHEAAPSVFSCLLSLVACPLSFNRGLLNVTDTTGFKSARHLQRLVSLHDPIANLLQNPHHDIPSGHHHFLAEARQFGIDLHCRTFHEEEAVITAPVGQGDATTSIHRRTVSTAKSQGEANNQTSRQAHLTRLPPLSATYRFERQRHQDW